MRNILLTIFFSAVSFLVALAQLPQEIQSRVPELEEFHEPIYQMWHGAWQEKNISQLKELLPAIEKAYQPLAAAKLPGILRDKETAWSEKLRLLAAAIKEYTDAASANDSMRILTAAENIHSCYEQMVRIVRPAIKELDMFHQVLYSIHHYYVPEYNFDKLYSSSDSLAKRMEELRMAKLPKRWQNKAEQYETARNMLDSSVVSFISAVKTKKDKKEIIRLEEMMHHRYEALQAVFE